MPGWERSAAAVALQHQDRHQTALLTVFGRELPNSWHERAGECTPWEVSSGISSISTAIRRLRRGPRNPRPWSRSPDGLWLQQRTPESASEDWLRCTVRHRRFAVVRGPDFAATTSSGKTMEMASPRAPLSLLALCVVACQVPCPVLCYANSADLTSWRCQVIMVPR